MQKKIVIFLFIIPFLIFLQESFAISVIDTIKQKAQNYAEYDELVFNLTEVSYLNKKYWWVDFSKAARYSGSLVLNEEGSPVKDEDVTFIIITAKIIKENYEIEMMKSWKEFSNSYQQLSDNLKSLTEDYSQVQNKQNVVYYLNILAEDASEISDLSERLSLSLNQSIYLFSPNDVKKYLEYENILTEKLERMDSHYDNTINSLRDKDSTKELEQFLRKNQDSVKNALEVMKSNRKNLDDAANVTMKEMMLKARTKEKEPTTIAWVSLGIFSFVLLLIIIFLVKKKLI